MQCDRIKVKVEEVVVDENATSTQLLSTSGLTWRYLLAFVNFKTRQEKESERYTSRYTGVEVN